MKKKKKKTKSLKPDLKSFLKSLSTVDFYSSLIFIAVTMVILLNVFSVQTNIRLKVGDVAKKDVYAYRDLEILDEATTLKKKREIISKTPNVYVYLSDKENEILKKVDLLAELFKTFNAEKENILKENKEGLPIYGKLKQTLLEKVSEIAPVGEESLTALDRFFSEEKNVEKLKELISFVYTRGYVNDKSLFVLKNGEAILFDSVRNQSFLIRQQPAVIDRKELKKLVKELLSTLNLNKNDIPLISDFIIGIFEPNYYFDAERTKEQVEKALSNVEVSYLRKKSGEIIVRKGERVNEKAFRFIEKQNALLKKNITAKKVLGYFLVLSLLSFLGFRLVRLYQVKLLSDTERNIFPLIMFIVTLGVLVIKASIFVFGLIERSLQFQSLLQSGLIFFAVPFVFPVSLTVVLLDGFAALIVAFFLAVLVIFITAGNIKLVLYAIFSSIAVIYLLRKATRRSSLLTASLLLGFFNFAIAFIILYFYGLITGINVIIALFVITLLGSVFAGGFVSTVSPLVESLFGIVSDMKLSELSTMDHPLLRQLSMKAPGTYQHSVRVATLAETAAQRINANSLLVKVGAYYHDIGKMNKPEYFIENLRQGEENKHTRLAPKISALILKNHVKEGVDMAEEYDLPEEIINFIKEHHGTKLMTYFYNKAVNMAEETGEQVMEEEYRYPGPKPKSKETAILMIADAIEAASRTLNPPISPGKIQHLVDRIVKDILNDGQLSDCNLTFKELTQIKQSFIEDLAAYYHTRVDYPTFDFNSEANEQSNKENGDGKSDG